MTETPRDELLMSSIDSASNAIETLQENVVGAIAAEKSGWFGARIKLQNGIATVVQVTIDQEIPVNSGVAKRRKKAKSN